MNPEFRFEDFEIDFRNPLGKGGFGSVYKATDRNNGKVYAVKRFSVNEFREEEIDTPVEKKEKNDNQNEIIIC